MKAVRIRLTQPSAHYRKAETVDNKMTYPLPFPSTVLGALHVACGYTSYHPMDVSIQGAFGTLQQEAYVDHCFLNSTMDDRGMLVKVFNQDVLSSQFTPVAKAKKRQGNSFKKGITIDVLDEGLLAEYRGLLQKREELDAEKKGPLQEALKPLDSKIKDLTKTIKSMDKDEAKSLKEELKQLKAEKKQIEDEFKQKELTEYAQPISMFKNLTTSLKYYEVLYEVELVIHVSAADDVLEDIVNNIDNLQCLGRSEDFVTVTECKLVELSDDKNNTNLDTLPGYSMYVHQSDFAKYIRNTESIGTKYYATKKYHLEEKTGRRVFEKIPVVLVTGATLGRAKLSEAKRVFVDHVDEDNKLLVDFL